MDDLAEFYDDWADEYEAAHGDWEAAIRRHGPLIALALAERGVHPGDRVLDCTCGIGTQAIGLARAGYAITGHDISARQIEFASAAARRLGVHADFAVADLLRPDTPERPLATFDAVVTANSLTHFHDESTLGIVLANIAATTRPGGIVAVTNRDYDTSDRPDCTPVQRSTRNGVRRVSLQLWDWDESGDSYRMESVLLRSSVVDASPAVGWTVTTRTTELRAWRRTQIEAAAHAAGLVEPRWHDTDWQPIFTAVRPR